MKKKVLIPVIAAAVVAAGTLAFTTFKKPGKIEGFETAATTVSGIEIPEGTRIVGLGEATHGNKEFQELKLEVFQTLVEKTNIRALILEGDFGGCAKANKYIQGGEGTAEEVTRELGYRIYRTDDMCALVQWMHDYNMTASDDQKVRLYGMDIQRGMNAKQLIKDMYAVVDEKKCADYSDKMDKYVGTEDYEFDNTDYDKAVSLMDEIAGDIKANKDAYAEKAGLADVEISEQATVAIKNYLELNLKENYSNKFRDTKMKEFVDWTLEVEEREHKGELMLACHNGHMEQTQASMGTYLGRFLNEEYQDAYFAIGTGFYITNDNLPTNSGRVVKKICSDDKLAYQVKNMDGNEYYIDFSKVDSSSELGNVINSKMRMGSLGEQYNILIKMMKGAHSIKAVPSDIYDAMVVYYEVNPITVWDN